MKVALCGNDCNACPRYIATKSESVEKLKEVAELWKKVGWRDTIVSPDEIACLGCESVKWCRYEIQKCVLNSNIENCGECLDYPCDKVVKAFEQTSKYDASCKKICTHEEYECFKKAFFSKKANLDNINMNLKNRG